MADARCPMCGKANPADLKECQYCHARLKPIWDSASNIDQPGPSGDQGNDLPEWLKSLRLPQDEQAEDSKPESQDGNNLPDWSSGLRDQPVEPGNPQSEEISNDHAESSDDDSSEWLKSFLAEDDLQEAEDETVSGVASDASLQDEAGWLSRIDATPVEEEGPREPSELLDWSTEPELTTPGITPSGEEDLYPQADSLSPEFLEPLPDWLLQTESPSLDLLQPEHEQLAVETQSDITPEPSVEIAEEEELPAWLFQAASDVDAITDTGDADLVASAEIDSAGGLPQEALVPSVQSADEIQPIYILGESPLDQILSEEGIPGLLAAEMAISESSEPPLSAPGAEETVVSGEVLALEGESLEELAVGELPPETPAEEVETPAEKAAPFLAAAGAAAVVHGLDLGEELPEEDLGWLDELETAYGGLSPNATDEATSSDGGAEGLGSMSTLPAWLTSSPGEEAQVSKEGEEDEGELKPADVPSWLQAMRPVGVAAAAASVLGDAESQQVEGAGPLAGLRGALPAEPDVAKVQKPPVYSIKLQVTDAQQLQAELLRGLIDSEDQPQVLPERSAIGSQKVIRLLIAAFLIIPLLFVLLTSTPQLSMPALPPEVDAVGRLIDSLPPGAPVLLAVDYQPGFSGEMDTITAPVLQHLFDRSAYLAAVSTIATGPVQAERLFAQMRISTGEPVQVNTNYTNLGYIPGGATGLLAFAQSPRDTLPTNLQGERVWDIPALQPADMLEKFAMVVVATDNPDVARYWIEQVQPYLGATPMVMVLSAQAEPVVRPYYAANPSQVQGLVGGLAGGAAYLGRSARSGVATILWSPYGVGALIAVILMVLAGLANLISAQVSRHKEIAVGGKAS